MSDKLCLLWKYNKLETIESDIESALGRWDKRPELENYLPEAIIFSLEMADKIKDEYLMTLIVRFEKTVNSGHFMIEGVKYK